MILGHDPAEKKKEIGFSNEERKKKKNQN